MAHHTQTVLAALAHLDNLMTAGAEYPDAEWKASEKFNVNSEDIRNAYDERDIQRGANRWIAED